MNPFKEGTLGYILEFEPVTLNEDTDAVSK